MNQQDTDLREQFIRSIEGLTGEELKQVELILLNLLQQQRKGRRAKASPQAGRAA